MSDVKSHQLTIKEQLRAIKNVAGLSFKTAPFAVTFKLIGSIVDALLPIATTYFAAKTTTALAAAYEGNPNAKSQIVTYVIITAVLGLIMTAWKSFDNYIQAKMRYVVETRITNQMYEHFLSLDFWRYDDKDTIDTYDRALKFSQFFAWVFDRLANIVSGIISVISAVTALLFVNWVIALSIFIALIPSLYVQVRLSRQQIRHWNSNVEGRRTLNMLEWLITQPSHISELRLYGMVKFLLKRRTDLRDDDELKRIEIERKSVPLNLLSTIISAVAEVAVLLWISLQIIDRKEPLGQFLYVQQLVSRAMSSASSLVSALSSIDEDVANLFDYQRFMELPTRKDTGKVLTGPPKTIRFENVSFHYPNDDPKDVLHNISLTINANDRIAIVGENGAGKSTFIKLLTGLYLPTGGNITLDGHSVRDFSIASWHRQLGVLEQGFISYGFATARDNVAFGDIEPGYNKERFDRAVDDAEATSFLKKLTKGADTYVNNWMEDDDGIKGADLSGGQWQRLALARNFYRNAPIIILDEPTSAIDALAEARIFERLFTKRKRTVITISHRLSTIKKADVIYMLKDGHLVETGAHDDLIARRGHFYHMFKAQIDG